MGENHPNLEHKLAGATTNQDSGAPNLYVMWKDHKEDFATKHQTRPVCDGTQGPLARISEVLVKILGSLVEGDTERKASCGSTEEMLREVRECNDRLEVGEQKLYTLFSMDVAALYPSIDHRDISECIEELVLRSSAKIEVKNKRELAKYIAVMVDEQEIMGKGLQNSIPTRNIEGRGKVTVAYCQEQRWRKGKVELEWMGGAQW